MAAPLPDLVDLKVAAKELGAAPNALERAAKRFGLLIIFGRKKKIDRNDYKELVDGCRVSPQEQDSTSALTQGYGSSAIPAVRTDQPALEIAAMLKKRLLPTSPEKAPSLAPVSRIGSR